MAFGVDGAALPGRCVLTGSASASDGRFDDDTVPEGMIYPYISWDVELSAGAGALSCGRHPLDQPDSGVSTRYVRGTGRAFSHAMHATDRQVSSRGRVACGGTVTSLDDGVSFASSPEGLTVRVGHDQSPFYPLPAGLALEGCCGDPCCSQ
jgi:hypothetical protein